MDLGKKGIVFSLLAVALSSLFLMWFADYYEPSLDEMVPVVSSRVLSLNDAINDAFSYAQRAAKMSSYSALSEMYERINTTGPYYADFNSSFVECAVNGTVACTNDINLTVLLDEYEEMVSDQVLIPVGVRLNSFEWVDERHFSVLVRINVSVWITDYYASWNVSQVQEVWVPTTGVYDPAFHNISGEFGGAGGERQIRPASIFNWNMTRFYQFYLLEQYNPSSLGPCLSHRFMGQWDEQGDAGCGIETIIHPNNYLMLQNDTNHPSLSNLTMVDHRVLRDERYPCHGVSDARVRIDTIGIVLSLEDATRFGLDYEDDC